MLVLLHIITMKTVFYDFSADAMDTIHINYIRRVINNKTSDKTNSIVLSLLWESPDPSVWVSQIQDLINQLATYKVYIILNLCYKQCDIEFSNVNGTIYIDPCLMFVYQAQVINKVHRVKQTKNCVSFITGKIDKINRIRLFYKLTKSKIFKHLKWTLPNTATGSYYEYLPELHPDEVDNFISLHHVKLGVDPAGKAATIFNGERELINHGMYDCLFQLVSETYFDRESRFPFITEKTWTAIALKVPFIIAGEILTYQYLESLGFTTYTDFLEIQNFDNPHTDNFLKDSNNCKVKTLRQDQSWIDFYNAIIDPSWPQDVSGPEDLKDFPRILDEVSSLFNEPVESISELRLDAIVKNIEHFYGSALQRSDELIKAVDDNYRVFVSLAKQQFNECETFFNQNCLDLSTAELLSKR